MSDIFMYGGKMPLELWSLEGLGDVPNISLTKNTPHYSVLLGNKKIGADITGAGSFTDIKNPRGAALQINASEYSHFGVFTDNNGNLIIVTQEDKAPYPIIKDKLFAGNVYQFDLPRNMGQGGAFEANAYIVSGINERYGNYAGWIQEKSVDFFGRKIKYARVPELLQKLEAIGQKFDKPIMVVLSGTPVSLSSVLNDIVSIVFTIAKPFMASLGISAELFSIIQNSVQELVRNGRVSINNIVNAAIPLAPPGLTSYLSQAKNIYSGIKTGNYGSAATELGLRNTDIAKFANSISAGDITGILGNVRGDYEQQFAKLQNAYNMETVDNLARATRSGSVLQQITDTGTITKVPVLRNAIFAASGNTHIAALPNMSELSAKIIQETADAENVHTAKAFIMAALGYPIPSGALDEILQRSMVEQALEQAKNGRNTYIMPVIVPYVKRAQLAASVAKESGLKTIIGKLNAFDSYTVCEWC